jgi:hypothetical protein
MIAFFKSQPLAFIDRHGKRGDKRKLRHVHFVLERSAGGAPPILLAQRRRSAESENRET